MKKQILSLLFLLSAAHATDKDGFNVISEESSFFATTQIQPKAQRNNNDNSFISDDSDEELHLLCASLQFNTETLELENFKNKFNESTSFVSSFITQTSQKLEKLHKDLDKMKKKYDKAKETAFKYKDLYEQIKRERDVIKEENSGKLNSSSNVSEEKIIPKRFSQPLGIKEIIVECENFVEKEKPYKGLEQCFDVSCQELLTYKFHGLPELIKRNIIYKSFIEFYLRAVNSQNNIDKNFIYDYFEVEVKEKAGINLKEINILQSKNVQNALEGSNFIKLKRQGTRSLLVSRVIRKNNTAANKGLRSNSQEPNLLRK